MSEPSLGGMALPPKYSEPALPKGSGSLVLQSLSLSACEAEMSPPPHTSDGAAGK